MTSLSPVPPSGTCRVDGGFLVVSRHGGLDGRCVVCGGKAVRSWARTITWTPRPRPIFALASRWWFLWVAYALFRRRTTTIIVGYCARHLVIRRACVVAVLMLLGVAVMLLSGPTDGASWTRWQVVAGLMTLVACTLPAGVLATEFHVDDMADDGSVRLVVDPRVLNQMTRTLRP